MEKLTSLSFLPDVFLGLTSQFVTLRRISSKDAYMLVYTRTPSASSAILDASTPTRNNITTPVPFPPPHALKVVRALNSAHDEACKAYTEKYIFIWLPLPFV